MATRRWSSKTMRIRSGWLRGSINWVLLFWGRFFIAKPLSQKHRSTFLPLHDANLTPSIGGFGVKRRMIRGGLGAVRGLVVPGVWGCVRSGRSVVSSGALRPGLVSPVGSYSSQEGIGSGRGRPVLSWPLSFAGMQGLSIPTWGLIRIAVRFVRSPSSSGTSAPLALIPSSLSLRSSVSRFSRLASSGGISPDRRLPPTYSSRRLLRFTILRGIDPLRLFPARSSVFSWERFAISMGISPPYILLVDER